MQFITGVDFFLLQFTVEWARRRIKHVKFKTNICKNTYVHKSCHPIYCLCVLNTAGQSMTPFIFKYISGTSLKTIYSIFILFSMLLHFLHLDNELAEEVVSSLCWETSSIQGRKVLVQGLTNRRSITDLNNCVSASKKAEPPKSLSFYTSRQNNQS